MAEFMKVVRDYNRMCSAHDNCRECPINGYSCNVSEFDENSEAIVEQWAAEHPAKTNRMALEEVLPSVSYERFCPHCIDGNFDCHVSLNDCNKCRNDWLDSEYKGGVDNG